MDNNMSIHGQILSNSTFALLLEKIIMMNTPNVIVEIGTWKGLGSTKRIIDAIEKANYQKLPKFISLETNKEFYDIAKNNLSNFRQYVDLVYGRVLEVDVIQEYTSKLELDSKHKKFLSEDLDNYDMCPNILNQIPEKIDFLLLDGGEFTSYLEWTVLSTRSRIIALDDTQMLKNKRVVEESLTDSRFELMFSSNERHGFHIFLNKSIV